MNIPESVQRIEDVNDEAFKAYKVHYLKEGRPSTKTFSLANYISETTAKEKAIEFNNKVNRPEHETIEDLGADVEALTNENIKLEKELEAIDSKYRVENNTLIEMNKQLIISKEKEKKFRIDSERSRDKVLGEIARVQKRWDSDRAVKDTLYQETCELKGTIKMLKSELTAIKERMKTVPKKKPIEKSTPIPLTGNIQDILMMDSNGDTILRLEDADKAFAVIDNKIQVLK